MSKSTSVTERLATAMPRVVGTGTLAALIALYGVLVLAATGRSVFQIIDHFDRAPVAITISAVSAGIYIVATLALIIHRGVWYRIAWITVAVEFAGVIVIGCITAFLPEALGPDSGNAFGDTATVWTVFGQGYFFVPLVLPLAGMWWLAAHRPVAAAADRTAAEGPAR